MYDATQRVELAPAQQGGVARASVVTLPPRDNSEAAVECYTKDVLVHDRRGHPRPDVRSQGGRGVAVTWDVATVSGASTFEERKREDRANARRIAAAWNACMGIATLKLEEMGTGGVARMLMAMSRKRAVAWQFRRPGGEWSDPVAQKDVAEAMRQEGYEVRALTVLGD